MPEPGGDVTRLLAQVREGDQHAAEELIPLIYNDLRRMAGACMRRERPDHTLQTTALVNEAYIRLSGGDAAQWQNRPHFFAIAAHTMRQVLLDYARRRHANKRGGSSARKVDIDDQLFISEDKLEDVIAIDQALDRLASIDARQSRLVELRFFRGLSVEEAAEVMGLAAITIKREWRSAKAWLNRELASAD